MADSDIKKIIFDTTADGLINIDALRDRCGFKTRSELIRNALALMHLTEDKCRNGYKLQFVREGEVVVVVLPQLSYFG